MQRDAPQVVSVPARCGDDGMPSNVPVQMRGPGRPLSKGLCEGDAPDYI
ncbi:MAG: hypothetical protein QOJ70_1323, partial [Acidobacteriota bacterium]|nr:hypothetical protein [Acidobacteriota bacterium]